MRSLSDERIWRWTLGLLVAVAALTAFAPGLDNDFVGFDDAVYILDNHGVHGLGLRNLRWMLTAQTGGLWQPLTLLSLAVDYRLWGPESWAFHFVNILLHAIVAVLFYLVCLFFFDRSRIRSTEAAIGAAAAAVFFAVHPLRVESVAWVTERKDVLSGAFWVAALLCRLKAVDSRRKSWEAGALAAFASSLLAKASGVTMPVVLLVLEVYPLRRLPPDPRSWLEPKARRVLLSLAPYAALSVAGLAMSVAVARGAGSFNGFEAQGPAWRLGQLVYTLLFYPAKTLWPAMLAPYYPPRPWFGNLSWEFFGCLFLVLTAAVAGRRLSRVWPAVGAVLVCYGVILLPMSGLVQYGMPVSAADRYGYLACLGFAVLFGAVFVRVGGTVRVVAAAWIACLGVAAWIQCDVWRDSISLWSTSESRAPCAFASTNAGVALTMAGRPREGLMKLEEAVARYPRSALCYDNLGVALLRAGDQGRAREMWRRGLSIEASTNLHGALGTSLAEGDGAELAEGLGHLKAAVVSCPLCVPWRLEYGDALAKAGQIAEADKQYAVALGLDPWLSRAYNNRGLLFARQGRAMEAIAMYRFALLAREARAEANYNWGNVLLSLEHFDEAERHYREALRLSPALAQAQVNLGNILARRGSWDEAAARYRAALKAAPGLKEAKANLDAVRRAAAR